MRAAATGALRPNNRSEVGVGILDLCMAPGGYTASALKYNAHAIASSDGTHLCYSHLENVLEVGKEFEYDFRGSGEMADMLSYA
ncbi:hypothetical protein V495_03869 [Pseudogymnoascus sp. VKM F-4514 (FW-929)]|jgi:hypothetical protein|nr:hypothetical protein V495_03869 [Pseudogymnoascus sp. VKM F-4514 (FW-929)]